MIAGGLVALSALPTTATAATVLEGDAITCSTNTFAFSACNGAEIATAPVVYSSSEFDIFASPNFDPLLTVDFGNGILTIASLADRTVSSTILTFSIDGKFFDPVGSGTGVLANRASLSGGALQLDLRGVTFAAGTQSVFAVSAVPEPGTWLLMILGLGAVGFAMRRSSTSSVRFQFA